MVLMVYCWLCTQMPLLAGSGTIWMQRIEPRSAEYKCPTCCAIASAPSNLRTNMNLGRSYMCAQSNPCMMKYYVKIERMHEEDKALFSLCIFACITLITIKYGIITGRLSECRLCPEEPAYKQGSLKKVTAFFSGQVCVGRKKLKEKLLRKAVSSHPKSQKFTTYN